MDFFADNLVKKCINNIILNRNTLPDDTAVWRSLTRLMFKHYTVHEVLAFMMEALEEASDEYWFEHKYPKGFFKETWVFPKKKKSVIKINLKKSRIRKLIDDHIKITDVAKSYGFKVKNNKILCPFHADSKPSLSLSDEKNVFNCFGCNAKGDIIEFKRRLKKWEKGMMHKKNF